VRRITLMLTVITVMVLMIALASPVLAVGPGTGLVTSTCAQAAGGAAASECQQPAPPP